MTESFFEFIVLGYAFQAGLSFDTILKKRENFRKAFDDFQPGKIARYTDKRIEKLLNDAGIIRNKLKIHATINNAWGNLSKFKRKMVHLTNISGSLLTVKRFRIIGRTSKKFLRELFIQMR